MKCNFLLNRSGHDSRKSLLKSLHNVHYCFTNITHRKLNRNIIINI